MLGGVAADVFDRRKLMMITQIGGAAVAAVLSVLAFAGLSVVWPVYVLAAIGAAVGAFDPPARHALMPMLVPREHLPNAINLNTTMVQAASVAGPGDRRAHHRESGRRLGVRVQRVSFLFVVAALMMMRDVPGTDRATAARATMSRSPRRATACASSSGRR